MVRLLGRCLPIICMPRKKRQSFQICEQQTTGTKHQDEINKLFVRRVESIRVTHQGAVVKRLPLHTINERHLEHKKTKSKSAHHNGEKLIKPDDTEFDCETNISDRQTKRKNRIKSKKKSSSSIKQKPTEKTNRSRSRTPLDKLFNKTKKAKTPSPTPSKIIDIPEEHNDDTSSISSSSSSSISSDWSTTTYPDTHSEKSDIPIQRRQSMPSSNLTTQNHEMKHRSCVESFYLRREHVRSSLSPPTKKATLPKIKEYNKNKTSQQQQQQNKRNEIKPPAKSKQVLQNVRKMIKDQTVQEQHFDDTRRRESVRL